MWGLVVILLILLVVWDNSCEKSEGLFNPTGNFLVKVTKRPLSPPNMALAYTEFFTFTNGVLSATSASGADSNWVSVSWNANAVPDAVAPATKGRLEFKFWGNIWALNPDLSPVAYVNAYGHNILIEVVQL